MALLTKTEVWIIQLTPISPSVPVCGLRVKNIGKKLCSLDDDFVFFYIKLHLLFISHELLTVFNKSNASLHHCADSHLWERTSHNQIYYYCGLQEELQKSTLSTSDRSCTSQICWAYSQGVLQQMDAQGSDSVHSYVFNQGTHCDFGLAKSIDSSLCAWISYEKSLNLGQS